MSDKNRKIEKFKNKKFIKNQPMRIRNFFQRFSIENNLRNKLNPMHFSIKCQIKKLWTQMYDKNQKIKNS